MSDGAPYSDLQDSKKKNVLFVFGLELFLVNRFVCSEGPMFTVYTAALSDVTEGTGTSNLSNHIHWSGVGFVSLNIKQSFSFGRKVANRGLITLI